MAASNVAMYTTAWSSLGSGVSGGTVNSVHAFPSTPGAAMSLAFVGESGGRPSLGVQKVEEAFHELSWAINQRFLLFAYGTPYKLSCCHISSAPLAAGTFTSAGGASIPYIAQWTVATSTWSALGTGLNNIVTDTVLVRKCADG